MTTLQKILAVLAVLLVAWGLAHVVQHMRDEWFAAQLPPDYYDNPNARIEVACPAKDDAIVIVAFGQSNSANFAQYRTVDTTRSVYNFAGGKCYLAKDPLLGANGNGGSLWIKLAQKLARQNHKKVVIQAFGVGNTSVAQWADDKGLGYTLLYSLSQLKPTYAAVDYFVWVQGERDLWMPPELYQQHLLKIINTTKQFYPTSLFGLSSSTYCMGLSSPKIAAAQKSMTDAAPGIFWLGDTDQFTSAQHRWGDCHLTTQGVDAVVDEFFRHILAAERTIGRQNLPLTE